MMDDGWREREVREYIRSKFMGEVGGEYPLGVQIEMVSICDLEFLIRSGVEQSSKTRYGSTNCCTGSLTCRPPPSLAGAIPALKSHCGPAPLNITID